MRIKMLTIAAGPKFSAQPDEIKDVEATFGQALIDGGHAVSLEPLVDKKAKAAADKAAADKAAAETSSEGEGSAAAAGEGAAA